MNTKLQLTLKTVIAPEFQRAIKALGEDPISVIDRFRLAQSYPVIVSACEAYETTRESLIKQHGERESVVLKRKQAARAPVAIKSPEDGYIARRLAEIEAGAEDRFAIDNDNADAMKVVQAESERLLAETITLPLTRKVKLSKDSKLTASQIQYLLEVVEIDDEPTAKE